MNLQPILYPAGLLLLLLVAGSSLAWLKRKKGRLTLYRFYVSLPLGWLGAAFAVVATYFSVTLFSEGMRGAYQYGLGWTFSSLGQLASLVILLGFVGVRLSRIRKRLGPIGVVDLLTKRYDSAWVGVLSALLLLVFSCSLMIVQWSVVIRVTRAVAREQSSIAIGVTALVFFGYVVWAGARGVVATDIIQGLVVAVCGVLLVYLAIRDGKTMTHYTVRLHVQNPAYLLPRGPDGAPTQSIWWVISSWATMGFCTLGLPHLADRVMSIEKPRVIGWTMLVAALLGGVVFFGFHMLGTWARIILPGGQVLAFDGSRSQEHLLLLQPLAQHLLPTGSSGLVLATVLAAALSTADSLLLTTSVSLARVVGRRRSRPVQSGSRPFRRRQVLVSRLLMLLVFGAVLLLSFNPHQVSTIVGPMAIWALGCTFLAPLLLGLFWRRANVYGTLAGTLTGLTALALAWLGIGVSFPWLHVAALPLGLSFAVNIVVSLLTPAPSPRVLDAFWGQASH